MNVFCKSTSIFIDEEFEYMVNKETCELQCISPYIQWIPCSPFKNVCLGGDFSSKELRFIADWMDNHKECGPE